MLIITVLMIIGSQKNFVDLNKEEVQILSNFQSTVQQCVVSNLLFYFWVSIFLYLLMLQDMYICTPENGLRLHCCRFGFWISLFYMIWSMMHVQYMFSFEVFQLNWYPKSKWQSLIVTLSNFAELILVSTVLIGFLSYEIAQWEYSYVILVKVSAASKCLWISSTRLGLQLMCYSALFFLIAFLHFMFICYFELLKLYVGK